MICPACAAHLRDGQSRCSDCGYSFSEELDLGTEETPPGVRPKEVNLAAQLLGVDLVLNAVLFCYVYIRYDLYRHLDLRVGLLVAAVFTMHALFIVFILWGVRCARILLLVVVACHVVFMVWGLMAAVAGNFVAAYLGSTFSRLSLGVAIEFYVAWLLLEPRSRAWFYS